MKRYKSIRENCIHINQIHYFLTFFYTLTFFPYKNEDFKCHGPQKSISPNGYNYKF